MLTPQRSARGDGGGSEVQYSEEFGETGTQRSLPSAPRPAPQVRHLLGPFQDLVLASSVGAAHDLTWFVSGA
jgi:hypothetical protein